MPHRSTIRRGALILALALATGVACAAGPSREHFHFGADLSYVNEMEDCGVVYREGGQPKDAYALFREHGTNLVRVRLWNDARWTRYSDLADVKETIRRAHAQGMQVLLDFHYSDDWADGDKQIVPKAWADISDTADLARTLYNYTYDVLMALDRSGLMPELVQVGNETNPPLLAQAPWDKHAPTDWQRNAALFNAGIRAVRDAGAKASLQPKVMLHIAQPENVAPWFAAMTAQGVTDFDLIGISYYRKWSSQTEQGLADTIRAMRKAYPQAGVMVVETAYPWTLEAADTHHNLLGKDALVDGYPATPDGQLRYLVDLTQTIIDAGGNGIVYWEPAWTTSACKTRWGRGSAWENATFFDFRHGNELLPGIGYMRHEYRWPAQATP
ncbi:MAG: arabinogalactan endo-1,4-beta-galactosidase [Thermomonas sp.]|uniref:glycoside hydrolase family 53 protein n=1 Tax=Thermomonas sp. TaxID=1971895 RepID=UPI0039E363A1